jgi:hypothetical protein
MVRDEEGSLAIRGQVVKVGGEVRTCEVCCSPLLVQAGDSVGGFPIPKFGTRRLRHPPAGAGPTDLSDCCR